MSTLCIIKTHRNNKFSSINLTAEEDKNISWGAKGLHTYLISRPPDWKVYFSELLDRATDGKKGLRSFIRELCETGYLDWRQAKDEKTKRFIAIHYDVYEEKNDEAIKNQRKRTIEKSKRSRTKTNVEPHTPLADNGEVVSGEVVSDKPVSGKEATTNNHSSINQDSNNQGNKEQSVAPQNDATKSMPKNGIDEPFSEKEKKQEAASGVNDGARTQRIVSSGETVTVSSVAPKNGKTNLKFVDRDLAGAKWMYERLQEQNPNFKKPNFESWANEIRLMREQDKRTYEEIVELLNWTRDDSFWMSNILSPKKLREKWDQLWMKKKSIEDGKARTNGHNGKNVRAEYQPRTVLESPQTLADILKQVNTFNAAA